jgi:hypothetical protein
LELGKIDGLWEECRQPQAAHLFFAPFHIETAHDDDRDVRLELGELLDEFKSGYARHDEIHKHGIVVIGVS